MSESLSFLLPDWPVPSGVRALVTTRAGGASTGPYAGLNLGRHVGDDPAAVDENRRRLEGLLPAPPVWLEQVHGSTVVDAGRVQGEDVAPVADASVARDPGVVCAVMTADCLPVIFASPDGSVVGVAHAGWRGLLDGVLEATIDSMDTPAAEILAWMGPAIGPGAFEVGEQVRDAYLAASAEHACAFHATGAPGKWLADLFLLARQRMRMRGVARIYGGGVCTWRDRERFYSYRRDGATGRFATLVWRESHGSQMLPLSRV